MVICLRCNGYFPRRPFFFEHGSRGKKSPTVQGPSEWGIPLIRDCQQVSITSIQA